MFDFYVCNTKKRFNLYAMLWVRMGALAWQECTVSDVVRWVYEQTTRALWIRFVAGMWGVWRWRDNVCCSMTLPDPLM